MQKLLSCFVGRSGGRRFFIGLRVFLIAILMASCVNSAKTPIINVDSYCAQYRKVIQSREDSNIKGTRAAKQRIVANEVTYVCLCERPEAEVCKKGSQAE